MGQTRASRRPSKPHSRPQALTPPTKRKMKTIALAVGLAVALAVATVSTCHAEKEETYLEAATHFCETMTPEEDHCGWVGVEAKEDASGVYDPRYQKDREVAINEINCPQCGTVWGGWGKWNEDKTDVIIQYPPNAIIGVEGGTFEEFPRYLSLGCRGKRVEFQAVYKLIKAEHDGSGPYYAGLQIEGMNMAKCSRGSGPEPGEIDVNCIVCPNNTQACPIEKDTLYEDTMILDIPEQCPGGDRPDSVMFSIFVNPYQTLNVSAFTATPIG